MTIRSDLVSLRSKNPFASDVVPLLVPTSLTEALKIGLPMESVIFPAACPGWAMLRDNVQIRINNRMHFLITIDFGLAITIFKIIRRPMVGFMLQEHVCYKSES